MVGGYGESKYRSSGVVFACVAASFLHSDFVQDQWRVSPRGKNTTGFESSFWGIQGPELNHTV